MIKKFESNFVKNNLEKLDNKYLIFNSLDLANQIAKKYLKYSYTSLTRDNIEKNKIDIISEIDYFKIKPFNIKNYKIKVKP